MNPHAATVFCLSYACNFTAKPSSVSDYGYWLLVSNIAKKSRLRALCFDWKMGRSHASQSLVVPSKWGQGNPCLKPSCCGAGEGRQLLPSQWVTERRAKNFPRTDEHCVANCYGSIRDWTRTELFLSWNCHSEMTIPLIICSASSWTVWWIWVGYVAQPWRRARLNTSPLFRSSDSSKALLWKIVQK